MTDQQFFEISMAVHWTTYMCVPTVPKEDAGRNQEHGLDTYQNVWWAAAWEGWKMRALTAPGQVTGNGLTALLKQVDDFLMSKVVNDPKNNNLRNAAQTLRQLIEDELEETKP